MNQQNEGIDSKIEKQAIRLATKLQSAKSTEIKLEIANKLSLLILARLATNQSRAGQILNKIAQD